MLQLEGIVKSLPSQFSFSEYDFGPCLVQLTPTTYYKTLLTFHNKTNKAETYSLRFISYYYHNTANFRLEQGTLSNHISTDFKSAEISPKEIYKITVFFHPLVIGDHSIELPFYLDGRKTHVTIKGKSVRLSLKNTLDKILDFGAIVVGKSDRKTISILNESEASINIAINFLDQLTSKDVGKKPSIEIEYPKNKKTELNKKIVKTKVMKKMENTDRSTKSDKRKSKSKECRKDERENNEKRL